MRAAALLAWASGLGFGLPGVYAIWHLLDRGEIATVMGYPIYGEGVFEDLGVKASVPLLVAFVVVCAAECAAGWLLWSGRRTGRSSRWRCCRSSSSSGSASRCRSVPSWLWPGLS